MNVVSYGPVFLLGERHRPGLRQRLAPLTLTGISERITQVRCMETMNYATYAQPMVLFDVMGFARPVDETPLLLSPGILPPAWGSVVRQIATGPDLELDDVEDRHTRLPAPETFAIDAGTVERARWPRRASRSAA